MIRFPTDLEDAASGGIVRAGGTDLMDLRQRGRVPGDLTDLRDVTGLGTIETTETGELIVGAKVKLADLAAHSEVMARYPGLAQASGGLATPQIRAVATVAGNLLQQVRCWYYRNPTFSCLRSGGDSCLARAGDHLLHNCYDTSPCAAPHASTVAVALLAYDAVIEIHGGAERDLLGLYGTQPLFAQHHALGPGELIAGVRLPTTADTERGGWLRISSRARAEWPLVEAVARLQVTDGKVTMARVVLGGVAPLPMRREAVEAALVGKEPTAEAIATAAQLAIADAVPLQMTAYKLPLVVTVIEDLLNSLIGEA